MFCWASLTDEIEKYWCRQLSGLKFCIDAIKLKLIPFEQVKIVVFITYSHLHAYVRTYTQTQTHWGNQIHTTRTLRYIYLVLVSHLAIKGGASLFNMSAAPIGWTRFKCDGLKTIFFIEQHFFDIGMWMFKLVLMYRQSTSRIFLLCESKRACLRPSTRSLLLALTDHKGKNWSRECSYVHNNNKVVYI